MGLPQKSFSCLKASVKGTCSPDHLLSGHGGWGGLNVAMKSVYRKSLFHGVNIPNRGPSISHLFHADDAVFIGTWESANFSNLTYILSCFHAASGLK